LNLRKNVIVDGAEALLLSVEIKQIVTRAFSGIETLLADLVFLELIRRSLLEFTRRDTDENRTCVSR